MGVRAGLAGGITAAVVVAVTAIGAGAADEVAAIKYRQSVMEAVGGHTGALAAIVKGEVDHVGDIKGHVAALDALAPMAAHIFPTAPETEKSDLLPAAWEKPQAFEQALAAYETATANLTKAAAADSTPKGIAPAFGELAKSCKGCHDSFRKKD